MCQQQRCDQLGRYLAADHLPRRHQCRHHQQLRKDLSRLLLLVMMAGVGVFLHRRHTHTEKRAVEVHPESEQTMCVSVSYLGSSLSWLILIIQVNLLSYGMVRTGTTW